MPSSVRTTTQLTPEWVEFNNRVTLFVTTACERKCPDCMQRKILRHYPGYRMSLDELDAFIEACRGHLLEQIVISGGEPLLWPQLEPRIRRIRDAPIAKEIVVFTNGMRTDKVTPGLIDCIDTLRISYYGVNENEAAILYLKGRYGKTVESVDRREHFPIPTRPLEDVLPAACNCGGYMVFGGKVFACPQVLSNSLEFGLEVPPEAMCDVEPGFMEKLSGFPRMVHSLCRGCVANLNVRRLLRKRDTA